MDFYSLLLTLNLSSGGGDDKSDALKLLVEGDISEVTNNMLEGATSIGNYAFYYCQSLTSVTIPNSVTSIGSSAFYNCQSLTSVTIPNSVTSIGSNAFQNCQSLRSVTISNSVTSIESSAFYYCQSLTSVTIPNSVTSIGNNAFYGCDSLTSVTVNATAPPSIGSSVFTNNSKLVIYVPAESVDTYKAASGWSTYAGRIQAIPSD